MSQSSLAQNNQKAFDANWHGDNFTRTKKFQNKDCDACNSCIYYQHLYLFMPDYISQMRKTMPDNHSDMQHATH